ncbi:MAG: eukaryotic-like serine/threonine-protein kinase [Thermococcaceae archaeon]|nr:eukaryotic-like serine/threonine-protein kinase [Thermococcaceae archaeon]
MRGALALVMILLVLTIVPAAKAEGRSDLWAKTYGGEWHDEAYAVALADNGDIIVAGATTSFGAGYDDAWVLRLDENGNVKWQKTYGGGSLDQAYAVAVADNGDIIVAGETWSFGGIWVLRLPPDGNLPDCDFCKDSEAIVMDTQAVVKNTKCKVKKVGGLFWKLKMTDTVAVVRTVKPEVKVLYELSEAEARSQKEIAAVETPKLKERLPAEVPKISESLTPASETKAVKGFPSALLSRYEPLEFLGEGGFAKVFKVKRKSDGEIVAIKIPRIDERTSGLFIKEVAAWYNLNHENIVRLYKADILPIPYLEMEFVEGVELDEKTIRDLDAYPKPVDEETALKIITGIANGLKHAHSKGIYHFDLKPLNVLLKSDLTPKITDWGLAKISARSSLSQHYGYSPLYASPEQLDEEVFGIPDHRTDIYQLGLIFYELLTGGLPYSATTPGALIGKILQARPKRPSEINPALAKYDGLFEKLLAKKKEDRFSSVEEFLEALNSLGELEREKEELRKTTVAMRKSRSREEFERLKVESVRKTIRIALLSARLNDKAELLRALDDLRFETRENFDDLVRAIEQVELLLREGIPIGNETFEMLRALLLRIEGEVVR